MTTFERIRVLLVDDLCVDPEAIKMESTLAIDLQLDSVELVELGLEIENAFDIEVPDSAINAGMTVQDVCEAVDSLRGK